MDAGVARAHAIRRLTWLVAVLLIWGAAIFAKLISIQVFHHAKYLADARRQQERKIDLPAVRGNIYDRNGHPLAMSVTADSVSVNPLQVPDISVAAELLATNLKDVNQEELYAKMKWQAENHKGYVVVKHHITPSESDRLRSLPVNWIDFTTETSRQYPNGEIAAHVLGGVYKQEEGAAGIEKAMDSVLKGRPGALRMLTDVKRRGIDERVEVPAQPGTPLQLTIDERIQFVAEREIKDAVFKHHCRSGSVVVMNPYNGEIYALANYPTYDPNVGPKEGDDPMARFDFGVSVPFEPGSVFKVITLSAALETTDLKPSSMIPTGNGVLALPGRIIHDTHAHGTISMQEVLEQSSNIGAILIGQRVGRERMYEYMRKFGFGQHSGVPLAAESGGLLRKLDRWGTTSLASVSMGQEISATSIQLARAAAVVANGGMLVKPKLILKRGDKLEPTEPPVRILKPETAITMRQMMEGVVLRGTGKLYCKLDGYTSGGKTGSAQIFDTKTHHYTHNYNASFMGFAPVTNPQLIVMVTLNGTVGNAGFGGPSAGPVFNKVASEALRILDVPKDLAENPNKEVLIAKNKEETDDDDVAIAGLGDGPSIVEEDPTAAPQLLAAANASEPAALVTPAVLNGQIVPNFRGKTVREVIEQSSESGMPVFIEGTGIAHRQSPLPGAILPEGSKVKVQFRR
jgi:cell division protein FtsI (penicillin-binding protein 3)